MRHEGDDGQQLHVAGKRGASDRSLSCRQYEQLEPGAELPRGAWRLLRHKAPHSIVNGLMSSLQTFSTPGRHLCKADMCDRIKKALLLVSIQRQT